MGKGNTSSKTDKKPKRFLSVLKGIATVAVALTSTTVLAVTALMIIANLSQRQDSREEYEALQEIAEALILEPEEAPYISAFDARMRQINPDYICWIRIDGTRVDYPVVRGRDNERYLHTSFSGEENILGTLFMDYRCVGEFVPHIIIFGHNSREGDLFGELWRFLDEGFLARHPIITIIVNDRIVEYEIFSARITDVADPAYQIDFSIPSSFRAFAERNGAPPDAAQIITLSTCFGGDDEDQRVIIQGALRHEP
jgi:sortase B